MDLVQHLVKEEVIQHHGGTWMLPSELREEQVPSSFGATWREDDPQPYPRSDIEMTQIPWPNGSASCAMRPKG